MLDLIKGLFIDNEGKLTTLFVAILIATTVILVGLLIYRSYNYNQLYGKYINVSNILAEKDSLRRVLQLEHHSLYERYSSQSKELDKENIKNKALKARLKETGDELIVKANIIQKFEIENQELKGKLGRDSIGEFVDIDTATAFYSIKAQARLIPPMLKVVSLKITDSLTIGYTYDEESGLIRGFSANTNPLVVHIGGSFEIKLQDYETIPIFGYIISFIAGIVLVISILIVT